MQSCGGGGVEKDMGAGEKNERECPERERGYTKRKSSYQLIFTHNVNNIT